MKSTRCKGVVRGKVCNTLLRYADDADTVDCGECGARYSITRRTRHRGGRVQLGMLAALRGALRSMPDACKRCEGTGYLRPKAAERAATAASLGGEVPPPATPCKRCGGTGRTGSTP